MGRKGKEKTYTQEEILEAINNSGAIISTIASILNCSWDTARKYCYKYKITQQAMKNEKEFLSDLCESTLIKAIKNGDTASAKWYLEKKAKDRGYGESENYQTQIEDNELKVVLDFGN